MKVNSGRFGLVLSGSVLHLLWAIQTPKSLAGQLMLADHWDHSVGGNLFFS